MFSVGSNTWRGISFEFYPALVVIGITFAAADETGNYFCWSRSSLSVIHESGIYFVISFSVSSGHVAKHPSLLSWTRVRFLGNRGSGDKIWLSLVVILVNIPWGAAVPLV